MNLAAVPTLSQPTERAPIARGAVRWWLLIAALLGLLLANLGSRGLNEPDESRYSNIALEMLKAEGSWWEPRMSGFAHYDKPPMIYWVTAISLKTFGRTEWAARLPSLAGAIMALAGLGWTAWRLYGNRAAWWAVLFCGTLGQFWVLARLLSPDMLLTGFVTLAIGFWAEARHRNAHGVWWWSCALCWTLAWWTKATAALVPLLGLAIGLWATRDRAGLRSLRPFWLLLVVLVAGAPWYLDLMRQHPPLRNFFFGRELAGRLVGHPDGRHGPIYYYLVFSLIGWMPWWPAALADFVVRWKEMSNRFRQRRWQALPLEGWMVITGLAVFSVMSSKLVTYTLPFAPWAALLCARSLVGTKTEDARGRMVRRTWIAATGFVILFVLASFLIPHWESRLGLNSSLREVAARLREKHASAVYLDQYMSGLEFYFGESVFYVTEKFPRELGTDTGNCSEIGGSHFVLPSDLPAHLQRHDASQIWFVRYKKKATSPLSRSLQSTASQETLRVGDLVLDRLPAPRGQVSKRNSDAKINSRKQISIPQ